MKLEMLRLYGNRGRCTPDPATVLRAWCDVCGTEMNVERNRFGPTGFAEAMGKHRHLHDRFLCPHYTEAWHKKIVRLIETITALLDANTTL